MTVTSRDASSDFVSRTTRGIGLTSVALSALTAGMYWRVRHLAPYRPVVERLDIPLPPHHRQLAGLRIGFLTDIHAGPFIGPSDVKLAADLLAEESPDLVLYGGDFVSESPRHLEQSMPVLAALSRRAPLGGIAVLGNHDIFVSSSAVADSLAASGILLLRNASCRVEWQGAPLHIVGIDDTLHGRPDLDSAYAGIDPAEATLALWHEPQFAEATAARGSILQLSGHTHGGQVRLPGLRPVWLPRHGRKYIMGLDSVNGMPVYTSRGVGAYRPPVRLNCPPELTVVTLR